MQSATFVAPLVRARSRYRRKHGMYSYKFGKSGTHKNTHAMQLKSKEFLKKKGYHGQLKIHERERLSDRPFGKITRKGLFSFDLQRVPFYNVPDLTDFRLKPYVPHITPLIDPEKKVVPQLHLTPELLE